MTDQHLAAERPEPPTPPATTSPSTSKRHRWLTRPRDIIRGNLRAYLGMNIIAYGMFGIGVVVALLLPEQTAARGAARDASGFTDQIASLLATPWLFALIIFAVNTVATGLAQILLPSLLVPFAGIAVFGYRAFVLGFDMIPTSQAAAIALVPHSLTLLIEFQAYVLLMLGGFLLGRGWIFPAQVGAANRRQGYLDGLRQVGSLILPTIVLLVIGALYEALTLSYLVPVLIRAWG